MITEAIRLGLIYRCDPLRFMDLPPATLRDLVKRTHEVIETIKRDEE